MINVLEALINVKLRCGQSRRNKRRVITMTIEEAIIWYKDLAELDYGLAESYHTDEGVYLEQETKCRERAENYEQLAEWLRELKIHREIHDVLLQLLVDSDLDICCEDLTDNEKEQKICEENCDNKTKGCWVRWAKMKAGEVNADVGVNN
jgi:hypothetical protein